MVRAMTVILVQLQSEARLISNSQGLEIPLTLAQSLNFLSLIQ